MSMIASIQPGLSCGCSIVAVISEGSLTIELQRREGRKRGRERKRKEREKREREREKTIQKRSKSRKGHCSIHNKKHLPKLPLAFWGMTPSFQFTHFLVLDRRGSCYFCCNDKRDTHRFMQQSGVSRVTKMILMSPFFLKERASRHIIMHVINCTHSSTFTYAHMDRQHTLCHFATSIEEAQLYLRIHAFHISNRSK